MTAERDARQVIASEYREFLFQEGAADHAEDFAEWIVEHLFTAGFVIRASGESGGAPALRADVAALVLAELANARKGAVAYGLASEALGAADSDTDRAEMLRIVRGGRDRLAEGFDRIEAAVRGGEQR